MKKPIKLRENERQLRQLSSNPHSTGSIKYLYTDKKKTLSMSNWILGFQNGYNQAVPGLHVMQFWSENILVISNQGDAVFDF